MVLIMQDTKVTHCVLLQKPNLRKVKKNVKKKALNFVYCLFVNFLRFIVLDSKFTLTVG